MKRIVLTGGPGAGKSTVLDVLRISGYAIGGDAARSIIRQRKAAGLSPRPEPSVFAEQVLAREIATYDSKNNSENSGAMFFERGILDVAGTLQGLGLLDEQALEKMVAQYRYDYVFLFPPWQDIYQMDEERDHTFEHAVKVHGSIRKWYFKLGYSIIEVPFDTPHARAEFILAHSNEH